MYKRKNIEVLAKKWNNYQGCNGFSCLDCIAIDVCLEKRKKLTKELWNIRMRSQSNELNYYVPKI